VRKVGLGALDGGASTVPALGSLAVRDRGEHEGACLRCGGLGQEVMWGSPGISRSPFQVQMVVAFPLGQQ
jgi:hypothetical protein